MNRLPRLIATALTAASLVLGAGASVQASQSDDTKAKKKATKEEEAAAKKERKYVELRTKSLDLYAKDPAFKAEVDAQMREVLRAHSEYAFSVNLSDESGEYVTRKGDRLKREDTLYDNPLVQDYVNRVGQSLVPTASPRKYAFKVILNPVPEARSLSTGTIYVTTGLIAAADNEAQLAYVLGHEIAHIEKDHWREDVLTAEQLERDTENAQKKAGFIGTVGRMLHYGGGFIPGGGVIGSLGALAALSVPTVYKLMAPDATFEWDKGQEDEADKLALQYMFERKYDPREVKYFFENLRALADGNPRVETGFIASSARIADRVDYYGQIVSPYAASPGLVPMAYDRRTLTGLGAQPQALPSGTNTPPQSQPLTAQAAESHQATTGRAVTGMTAAIEAAIADGVLKASTEEGYAVLAQINRDNGIRALYYDLYDMALANLRSSVKIRSNDPLAQYYFGKALRQVARTRTELNNAAGAFRKAIAEDSRGVVPEARFYLALTLMSESGTSYDAEIIRNFKEYVLLYQNGHGGTLPPNMEMVYSYLKETGDLTWSALPVVNVSTRADSTIAPTQTAQPVSTPTLQQQPSQPRRKSGKRN
jgi:Zn-dependent protease with chaperone function